MVRHKHHGKSYRRRKVSQKRVRDKGTIPSVNVLLRKFRAGEKVHIALNPSIPSAAPHRRFIGKTGSVLRKQGACYLVEFKDRRSTKKILLHPAHIKSIKK